MKINLNDFEFDELDELPVKQKLVKKKKIIKPDTEMSDKKDNYKKRKKDDDVLF